MRRIPIMYVHLYFGLPLLLCWAIALGLRGCEVSDRTEAIETAKKDQSVVDWAAGKVPEDQKQRRLQIIDRFYTLRDRYRSPNYGTNEFLLDLDEAASLRAGATNRLLPTQYVADLGDFARTPEVAALRDTRQRVPEVIGVFGGGGPAVSAMKMPAPLKFWDGRLILWAHLAGALLAALLFTVRVYKYLGYHPIRQFPWQRADALLLAALLAPVSVAVVLVYVFLRALSVDWVDLFGRFLHRSMVFGYRIGILRKTPAPVLVPASFEVGSAQVSAAPAAETAVKSKTAAAAWFAVRRSSFLGATHLLQNAGIEVYPMRLHVPKQLTGFAVPAGRIAEFERLLGLTEVERTDSETDVESVHLRSYASAHGEIDLADAADGSEPRLRRILKAVSAKAGGLDLSLQVCDGDKMPLAPAGRTVIFWPATPAEPEGRQVRRILGRDWSKSVSVLQPSLQGVVIKDEDGTPIAQVINNSIYVLVDRLPPDGPSDQESLADEAITRLLHEAVAASQARAGDDEVQAMLWRDSLNEHRQRYVEQCLRRVHRQRSDLEKKVRECDEAIASASQEMSRQIRERRSVRTELQRLIDQELKSEEERLAKEFDALCASKSILSLEFSGRELCVYTRTVHIDWQGKRYRIGRFLLRLSEDGRISIANLSNTAQGTAMHHPHVSDPQRPCFGNIQESLVKLLAAREFAAAVSLLFRYLESYNPHPGVGDITHWKEVPHEV